MSCCDRVRLGSSPRVRGKPCIRRPGRCARRLIPAHAGKTLDGRAHDEHHRAHPRACGENRTFVPSSRIIVGSSPRMRGKLTPRTWKTTLTRLIPAHAGKTCIWSRLTKHGQAHPRACGENAGKLEAEAGSRGSSPRMRGKRLAEPPAEAWRGLIPAHAGKTLSALAPIWHQWAHPRACGENVLEGGDVA